MAATFEVSRRGHVGDWWWVCVDDSGRTLFSSPLSFEHPIQAFTEVNRIRAILEMPTKVVLISEGNNNSILV